MPLYQTADELLQAAGQAQPASATAAPWSAAPWSPAPAPAPTYPSTTQAGGSGGFSFSLPAPTGSSASSAFPAFLPTVPAVAPPKRLDFGVGFDPTKLNDLNYISGKYTKALRHFAGLKDSLPPTTASLQIIVNDAKANGFPNARVAGADLIDYGDGYGPIDVITDVGGVHAGWAFQNTTGNALWESQNPGSKSFLAPGSYQLTDAFGNPVGVGPGGGSSLSSAPGTNGGLSGAGGFSFPAGGLSGTAGADGSAGEPNEFTDPSTQYLENFLKSNLADLRAPLNDPARDRLAQLLDDQTSRYGDLAGQQAGLTAGLRSRQEGATASADDYINYLRTQATDLQGLPPEIQAAYDQLVKGSNTRITDLSQLPPQLAQSLAAYRTGTSSRIADLQNLPPELQTALDSLRSGTQSRRSELQGLPPELQAALAQLTGQTQSRIASLKAPAYTGTEQEILRTQALDPIEADRQAAKQRDLARIGQSGMLPSSGIALALQNQTDQQYDRQRNTAQGDIAAKQIQERRQRDAEIQALSEGLFGTQSAVSAVGEGRKTQAQQLLESLFGTEAQVSAIGEGRKTQAQQLRDELQRTDMSASAYQDTRRNTAQSLRDRLLEAATGKSNLETSRRLQAGNLLGSIPGIQRGGVEADLGFEQDVQGMADQIYQAQIGSASQRAGLNQQTRGEDTARRQEALTLASVLQQLPTAAAQQAMAAIGQAPNPESLINQLITMFGIGQTTRNQNAQYYSSLAQSLPYLASSLRGRTSGAGAAGLPGGSTGPF